MRRTVVIGLGGTGRRALTEVRRRIIDAYGSLEAVPWVRFVVIDTDPDSLWSGGDQPGVRLRPDEAIDATVRDVREIQERLDHLPHIADWLDGSLLFGFEIDRGTRRCRAAGRLAFFRNSSQIYATLGHAIDRVMAEPSEAPAGLESGSLEPGLSVFVVASLSGGTGSGMLIDLAYALREGFRRDGRHGETIGFLLLPGLYSVRSPLECANTYAALTELNHYSCADTAFEARYEEAGLVARTTDPPFDLCYLLQPPAEQARAQGSDEPIAGVARRIFLEVATELGGRLRGARMDRARRFTADAHSFPASCASSGVSGVHLPRRRMVDILAARLAREVVQQWCRSGEPGSAQQAREAAGAYVRDERLDPHAVAEAISVVNRENGQTHADELGAWSAQARAEAGSGQQVDWVERVQAQARDIKRRFWGPERPLDHLDVPADSMGEYVQAMVESTRSTLEAKTDALRRAAADSVGSPLAGRVGPTELLLEIGNCLASSREKALRLVGDLTAEIPRLSERVEEATWMARRTERSALLRIIPWQRRGVADRLVQAIEELQRRTGDRWALRLAVRFYEELGAAAEEIRDLADRSRSVLGRVEAQLGELCERQIGEGGAADGVARWIGESMAREMPRLMKPDTAAHFAEQVERQLEHTDGLLGLGNVEDERLVVILMDVARQYTEGLGVPSPLDSYLDSESSVVDLERLQAEARPCVRLMSLPPPGYPGPPPENLCLVGLPERTKVRFDVEALWQELAAAGHQMGAVGTERIEMSAADQIAVVSEWGNFALALLEDIDRYREAYDETVLSTEAARGLHTHKDVPWRPIRPPARGPRAAETIPSVAEVRIGEVLLKISTESLVNLDVDAIACSRSRGLRAGKASRKSAHGAIQRAGGMEITTEASRHGPIDQGAIVVTGGGSLPADHVVHAAILDDLKNAPVTEEVIVRATGAILDECRRREWKSVALPLMGTRAGNLTEERCADAMFDEVARRANASVTWPEVVVFSLRGLEGMARLVTRFTEARERPTVEPGEPERGLVFISAKSEDYGYAEQVYRYLLDNGVPAFFSKESLPRMGDADYRRAIDDVLETARHMIVVTTSREHLRSPWVEAEWGFFVNEIRSGRKTGNLITLTVGTLPEADLPPSLRNYQVIPFAPDDFATVLQYVGR